VEVLIPFLQQELALLFYEPSHLINLIPAEPAAKLKSNGIDPTLGFAVFSLNVNMWRLVPVTGVKEEPVRTNP
jgi:hypothetical protein